MPGVEPQEDMQEAVRIFQAKRPGEAIIGNAQNMAIVKAMARKIAERRPQDISEAASGVGRMALGSVGGALRGAAESVARPVGAALAGGLDVLGRGLAYTAGAASELQSPQRPRAENETALEAVQRAAVAGEANVDRPIEQRKGAYDVWEKAGGKELVENVGLGVETLVRGGANIGEEIGRQAVRERSAPEDRAKAAMQRAVRIFQAKRPGEAIIGNAQNMAIVKAMARKLEARDAGPRFGPSAQEQEADIAAARHPGVPLAQTAVQVLGGEATGLALDPLTYLAAPLRAVRGAAKATAATGAGRAAERAVGDVAAKALRAPGVSWLHDFFARPGGQIQRVEGLTEAQRADVQALFDELPGEINADVRAYARDVLEGRVALGDDPAAHAQVRKLLESRDIGATAPVREAVERSAEAQKQVALLTKKGIPKHLSEEEIAAAENIAGRKQGIFFKGAERLATEGENLAPRRAHVASAYEGVDVAKERASTVGPHLFATVEKETDDVLAAVAKQLGEHGDTMLSDAQVAGIDGRIDLAHARVTGALDKLLASPGREGRAKERLEGSLARLDAAKERINKLQAKIFQQGERAYSAERRATDLASEQRARFDEMQRAGIEYQMAERGAQEAPGVAESLRRNLGATEEERWATEYFGKTIDDLQLRAVSSGALPKGKINPNYFTHALEENLPGITDEPGRRLTSLLKRKEGATVEEAALRGIEFTDDPLALLKPGGPKDIIPVMRLFETVKKIGAMPLANGETLLRMPKLPGEVAPKGYRNLSEVLGREIHGLEGASLPEPIIRGLENFLGKETRTGGKVMRVGKSINEALGGFPAWYDRWVKNHLLATPGRVLRDAPGEIASVAFNHGAVRTMANEPLLNKIQIAISNPEKWANAPMIRANGKAWRWRDVDEHLRRKNIYGETFVEGELGIRGAGDLPYRVTPGPGGGVKVSRAPEKGAVGRLLDEGSMAPAKSKLGRAVQAVNPLSTENVFNRGVHGAAARLDKTMRAYDFLLGIKRGWSVEKATRSTRAGHVFYGNRSPFALILGRIIPFMTFEMQNPGIVARGLARNPGVARFLQRPYEATQQSGDEKAAERVAASREKMPDFQRDAGYLPSGIAQEEGNPNLFIKPDNIVASAQNLFRALGGDANAQRRTLGRKLEQGVVAKSNPAWKSLYAVIAQRDPFTGVPFEIRGQTGSGQTATVSSQRASPATEALIERYGNIIPFMSRHAGWFGIGKAPTKTDLSGKGKDMKPLVSGGLRLAGTAIDAQGKLTWRVEPNLATAIDNLVPLAARVNAVFPPKAQMKINEISNGAWDDAKSIEEKAAVLSGLKPPQLLFLLGGLTSMGLGQRFTGADPYYNLMSTARGAAEVNRQKRQEAVEAIEPEFLRKKMRKQKWQQ